MPAIQLMAASQLQKYVIAFKQTDEHAQADRANDRAMEFDARAGPVSSVRLWLPRRRCAGTSLVATSCIRYVCYSMYIHTCNIRYVCMYLRRSSHRSLDFFQRNTEYLMYLTATRRNGRKTGSSNQQHQLHILYIPHTPHGMYVLQRSIQQQQLQRSIQQQL